MFDDDLLEGKESDNVKNINNEKSSEGTDSKIKGQEEGKLENYKIYLFMLLLLITGSINTIANKYIQNSDALGKSFQGHQKFITFCMFLGELLCLLFYFIKSRISKKNESDSSKPSPKLWYFALPALFDIFGSSIGTMSLSFLDSSVYQMFRGAIIIFTCIASIIVLKSKYFRHHFLGIGIVVVGLLLIGLKAILVKDSKNSSNAGLGIFLVLLGEVFSSLLYISEESILKKYEISPLKAVGLEGMWGSSIYIILLFIFYFISCKGWDDTIKENMCVEDDNHNIRFENAPFAFEQLGESTRLKFFIPLYIFSIAFFNFSGQVIAQNVSSTARAIVDTLRTIIIWGFFMMPFVEDKSRETFHFLQLIGFLILILGSLIYNEILVIPIFGFNRNLKKNLSKDTKNEEINSIQSLGFVSESNND